MWPGTDFAFGGRSCDFSLKFNMTATWTERVDKALSWFKDPYTPANFVMMYFEEPDFHGHAYSPDSEVVRLLNELRLCCQLNSFFSDSSDNGNGPKNG